MQSLALPSGPVSIGKIARQAGSSLLLAAVLPWIAYQVLTSRGVESITALALTAIFPVAGTAIGWVRLGRPDIIGVLSVTFIAISLTVGLTTGSELVILARRSVNNLIFAGLCFGSLWFDRPLMFYLARQYMAGWDRSAFDSFAARLEQPGFRRAMRRITFGWGCWLVVQAIARVVAADLLDVSTFLIVSPTVTAIGSFAMLGWSFKEVRTSDGGPTWDADEHGRRLGEAARQALARATEEARGFRQPGVGTEHLLVALGADEQAAGRELRRVSVTMETARATVETLAGHGDAPTWQEPELAPRLRAALRRAFDAHHVAGLDEIGTEHLLIGLLDEPDGMARQILTYMGVDLPELRARLVGPREVAPRLVAE